MCLNASAVSRWHAGKLSRRVRIFSVHALSTKEQLLKDKRDNVYVSIDWLKKNLESVAVVDVRGRVDTQVVEPGVEQSKYEASKDEYLRGHIQVCHC
jgi:hypothetical protein